MRMRNKAFLSCAVVTAGLLAATPAMAQTDSCSAGGWLVEAFGPTPVSCGTTAGCTEIKYQVSNGPTPDHVAAVVASGGDDCSTPSIVSVTGENISGNQFYAPGVGDPITGLGKYSCHDEAAKVNPNSNVSNFTIRVSGKRGAAPRSVVVKKGGKIGACEILGIGDDGGEIAPVVETLTHDECSVAFTLDRATGRVLNAELTIDSPDSCDLIIDSVENLSISLAGVGNLGNGRFGDGYIHSGNGSCTTRIIGGRTYTWGSPCP